MRCVRTEGGVEGHSCCATFHKNAKLHRIPREQRHIRGADIGKVVIRKRHLGMEGLKAANGVERIIEGRDPEICDFGRGVDDRTSCFTHLPDDE